MLILKVAPTNPNVRNQPKESCRTTRETWTSSVVKHKRIWRGRWGPRWCWVRLKVQGRCWRWSSWDTRAVI